MTILCIGDAHLGRFPTRVPNKLDDLAVRFVWERSVSYAIDHKVNAVVLTGDMVDSNNYYFESYGPLKREIKRLVDNDIPVYAVAGNHDHDVFPRLARDMNIENFTVLGLGGHWDEAVLKTSTGEQVCLVGWSFPNSHCTQSPLDTFKLPNVDLPIIGIVHGDLDAPKSDYAPLSLSALQQQRVAVWLLGHIHKPQWIESAGAPVLYSGSLQALDPGETGTHGPWLVTIDPDGVAKGSQLALATVRYESVEIDVTSFNDLNQAQAHITQHLERRTQELSNEFPELKYVVFRPSLTGRTTLHRLFSQQLLESVAKLDLESGTLQAYVDKVTLDTTPKHDLQEIARFGDPPAILAKWLLDLNNPQRKALITEAQAEVQRIYDSNAYSILGNDAPGSKDTADLLLRQGQLLLDELMGQKDNA